MGNVNSEQKKSSTLEFSFSADSVIQSRGEVKAQGPMAVKIGNKTVSVTRPSNVFWVGVLLKKNGWIHTGVGLRNDITVRFTTGKTETYNYMVAHAVSPEQMTSSQYILASRTTSLTFMIVLPKLLTPNLMNRLAPCWLVITGQPPKFRKISLRR